MSKFITLTLMVQDAEGNEVLEFPIAINSDFIYSILDIKNIENLPKNDIANEWEPGLSKIIMQDKTEYIVMEQLTEIIKMMK